MTDTEKILKLLERENLTAKKCADIIGITRSSMSHIINGRNNPSLEMMRKILEQFPNINPEWLILEKGEMYRQNLNSKEPELFDNFIQTTSISEKNDEEQLLKKMDNSTTTSSNANTIADKHKTIESIIVFFSDHTYEELKH